MSANVWNEEVSKGLLQEIKSTVRVKDKNNEYVALEDNALIVIKPEEDFKIETFPSVSICNIGSSFDKQRYSSAPIVISKDIENKQVTLEDPATPFKLNFQIDFWAQYQTDIDTMTRKWLIKHFHQFNLPVVDDGDNNRSCNCLMLGKPVTSNLVLNGERLFHTIISYTIWVELDEETRYNVSMVTDAKFGVESN